MVDALTADILLGNRYRLVREVARGGMATVWEAEDSVLGRRVAVKVLHPHLASDASFRERFRREALAVARLSHPGVVAVYDTGEDGDLAYLVMELVEGRTLKHLLDDRGALDLETAVSLVSQVADGLALAHERGIVHRDVKPGNILVSADGRAKLTDFGIARGRSGTDLDEDLTQVGTIVGTARYVSPEQIEGHPVDQRTDVYALGLVLYEALCGRPAFDEDTDLATALARTRRLPLSPRQVRVDVPRELEAVVLRALAVDPDERYPSAAELRSALLAVNLGDGDPTPETGIALPAADDRRFTAGVLGVIAIAVVVSLAGFILAGTEAGRSVFETVRDRFPGGQSDPTPVAIAALVDHDPFGDGVENSHLVPLALDGNPETAWRTSRYHEPQREFGNLKPGLGLAIHLEESHSLRKLDVRTFDAGWDAAVYVGDGTAESLDDWGEPVAVGTELGRSATFDLRAARGQSLLLWFTRLPPSGQLHVAEIDVKA